jgi:hypothetical protein
MSSRRFKYADQEWEAIYDGFGVGAGSGSFYPPADHFSFTFRSVSNPTQPAVRGHLSNSDPHALKDADLAQALKTALERSPKKG